MIRVQSIKRMSVGLVATVVLSAIALVGCDQPQAPASETDTQDDSTPAEVVPEADPEVPDAEVPDAEVPDAEGSDAVGAEQRAADRAAYEALPLLEDVDIPAEALDPEENAESLFGRPPTEEGAQPSVVEREDFPDYTVILVTNIGLGDDSVRGERYRIEYEQLNDQSWQVVWIGKQQQCARGENAGEWTIQLCP